MKKLLTLIAIVAFSLSGYSQISGILYEYTWYLEAMEIDGVNYTIPANEEVPFITAEFSETSPHFLSAICDTAEGDIESVMPGESFRFPTGLDITPVTCADGDNETFENHYFNDFFLANINEEFYYEVYIIDGNNPSYGLVIWLDLDNYVSYLDKLVLNVPDNEEGTVAVYPNPVNEVLNLRFISEMSFPLEVSMIDTAGRIFLSEDIQQSVKRHQLDVKDLPNGLYFVQIEDQYGNKTVKRIVR